MALLLKNGTLVTMDPQRRVLHGDILVENETIKKISPFIEPPADCQIIDCTDHFVIPGLIQAHTHLCQTLFRGLADDLALLDWLTKKIWPLEASHTPETLASSARLGLLEMQKCGTTTILDMATVHHTEALFEQVESSGIRYWGGKCLMDDVSTPNPLSETIEQALSENEDLYQKWHQKTPLIQYALCPRFAISCSEMLLKECSRLQKQWQVLVHTHASENKDEVQLIKERTGKRNVEYLDALGLINPSSIIVHGVHLSEAEEKTMIQKGAGLVHCPASNLKLGSGVAPIQVYVDHGMNVAVGSDGAPCNNTMDPFVDLRLMALLQKPIFGPEALAAEKAFEIATLGGAAVLGQSRYIGSLEEGKYADIVAVDRSHPSVATVRDPYSALVYSCSGRDVSQVICHGQRIIDQGQHCLWDEADVLSQAKTNLDVLAQSVDKNF